MDRQSPEGLTQKVKALKKTPVRVKERRRSVILVSLVSDLIGAISILIAFVAISIVMLWMDYHHDQCAQHEPYSQFTMGDVYVIQECPFPDALLQEALVESYSDEVPDA